MTQALYVIKVSSKFSSAHALRHYQGKCESLHGHNFIVEAEVEGRELDSKTGLLIDFSELKNYLNSIVDYLDHSHLNEKPPFDTINPSSENISCYIYQELEKKLQDSEVNVRSVAVCENDNSKAIYMQD
ncbi:MAG: 6-carboxytetrahydropterin synthase QueD [Thermodesulfobacteriota bacterium]